MCAAHDRMNFFYIGELFGMIQRIDYSSMATAQNYNQSLFVFDEECLIAQKWIGMKFILLFDISGGIDLLIFGPHGDFTTRCDVFRDPYRLSGQVE
jgi:hypothetical protein